MASAWVTRGAQFGASLPDPPARVADLQVPRITIPASGPQRAPADRDVPVGVPTRETGRHPRVEGAGLGLPVRARSVLRSSPHGLLFPTAAAAGFTKPFSWPEPSAGQAFGVSGELPATSEVRFRAAFGSRSLSSPQAPNWKKRSESDISSWAAPQPEHVFVDGKNRGATTNRDPYRPALCSSMRRNSAHPESAMDRDRCRFTYCDPKHAERSRC